MMSIGLSVVGVVLPPIIVPQLFPKYDHSIKIIQIMSISVIPTTINLIFASKFLAEEKNVRVLVGTAVYITSLISLIVLLGKMSGVNGMAVSLVIANFIQLIFYFLVNKLNNKNT